MDGITLDPVALEQLQSEQKALLDAIDDLRKHGVGRFIDLPQIIVVGDQSSGKSSVLEAISRVRFPVKDELCTRFATELVLRTNNQTRVDVRIHPSATSKNKEQPFDEKSFDKDELPRIIEDAKSKMLKDDAGFSEDVLRIEISSPDVPHLTLVDLPGFYHGEDDKQSAAGRDIVDRLAERYMARKNSIILAIISARNQVILQKVLSKVKHHDKEKRRTLGIITKPDTLTSGSQDEANFIRLAKNLDKSHDLSLGWHVLRNRSEKEALNADDERDEKERKFFESSLWSSVPSKNRGVEALRKKLSGILLGHIKNNLQDLILNIEENINDRKTQLDRLGESRLTEQELKTHLERIASKFHLLCLYAVQGNYADEFFGGLYPGNEMAAISNSRIKKLRALVRDLNRIFAYVLQTKGMKRIILPKDRAVDETSPTHGDESALPSYLWPLASLYKFEKPKEDTFEKVSSELESLSSSNQGNEFPGTSNDRIAVDFFQEQSQPWEEIARFHLGIVLHMAKAFVEKLMEHIIGPDKRTCSAILSDIVDPFFDRKSTVLQAKLHELLYHYKSGYPQPLDMEFRELLTQRRHKKNIGIDTMRNLIATRPELFTDVARMELERSAAPKGTSEFGVDGLIEKAETYYEMSLRTFTDNVIVLSIENCLMRDLPSIFDTTMVSLMKRDELERLASESPEIQVEREELKAECNALKKGLQICNRFRERKTTSVPSILLELDRASMTTSLNHSSGNSPVPTPDETFSPPVTPQKISEKAPKKTPGKGSISDFKSSQSNSASTFSMFSAPDATVRSSRSSSNSILFPSEPSLFKKPIVQLPPEPNTNKSAEPPSSAFTFPKLELNPFASPHPSFSPKWSPSAPLATTSSTKQDPDEFFSPLPFGAAPFGTRFVTLPFQERESTYNQDMNSFQHICTRAPYDKYSPEELMVFSYVPGSRFAGRLDT
ncbi:P-loop containing nucleoside triphosphate hydrolase protein [Hypoxylon trugodes]|uniref:P-loop containing nucleoside triphosphate hydrolase protein n=1 Tax=Hypoxylon trugodes TaxID=326681 RepID=UPI00219DAA9A|nr:P-loop containing nucleoside triphosphate hydrolase protein [Hypoxylon trugodes]KAI1386830.1 P-loop containing nucleoside triphosphate hydrolase protein [Hypoxylon trugodes]